jgi:3-hydroxyisobutyryl-CoA hydrolase
MCQAFHHLSSQEKEKASTYDEWCERAISKIKEAAPLILKVTLQSVN